MADDDTGCGHTGCDGRGRRRGTVRDTGRGGTGRCASVQPDAARCASVRPGTGHTGHVVANITFGSGIPGDDELRLCGEIGDGRRALELGISPWFNAVSFAATGAKALAVDADEERIAETRRRATDAELQVQCLRSDLADLGDIASASCDVVLAAHTITDVDDLGRLLRQVHRVLRPSAPLVISLPHPYAAVSDDQPYGSGPRTVGEWFTSLARTNFRVDQILEFGAGTTGPAPSTLIVRAHKEGS
jgi:SAM-dependent methyltransferase